MTDSPSSRTNVGFVGLGAMGSGMAFQILRKPEFFVKGYDVYAPSKGRFASQGGDIALTPRDLAKKAQFLIFMVVSGNQVDDFLFNEKDGALQDLPQNAIIIIMSTVSFLYHEALPARIAAAGRSDVSVLDCPVSGGTARAAEGTLTVLASGPQAALDASNGLLSVMSANLYPLTGPAGVASKIKMVNQLMVGCHITAAAEAMALAERAGLDGRAVYKAVVTGIGNSWAFENRVPHMLDNDWTPLSAVDIFVKDMGIVVSTARELQFPLPVASAVEQVSLLSSAQGFGRDDDASIIRTFNPTRPQISQHKSEYSVDAVRINQLLSVVHTAIAAEAIAFARRLDLDTNIVFEILGTAAASSVRFRDRVPQMLKSDWAGDSTMKSVIMELDLILSDARIYRSFCPVSSAVHALYLSVAAQGYGNEADAGIVRFWSRPS